ncbi:hypothetical protein T4D_6059 [Trichinella pseudospiralis]|uniref:Replicase polyprotein 1a n=1 Tax=Trichinella pseudospiralis TaxID=6337 RepID=A0A0V1FER2_TRIPS|nr:hypothetical protein T4D_6059 [Trichinella pseudospiralis]
MDENNNDSSEELDEFDQVNSATEDETILSGDEADADTAAADDDHEEEEEEEEEEDDDDDDSVNDANNEALAAEGEQDESNVNAQEKEQGNDKAAVLHEKTYVCPVRNEIGNDPRITFVSNFRLTTSAGKPCYYWGPILFPFLKDLPTENDDAPE